MSHGSHVVVWLRALQLLKDGLKQNLDAQRHAGEQPDGEDESPCGLWHSELVDECVQDTREDEHAEVPESCRRVRLSDDVEKTEDQERWNVLNVVQVIPTNSLHFIIRLHSALCSVRLRVLGIRERVSSESSDWCKKS